MQILNPIYTQKTECQDCYKCVRGCPVKAIKIENGSATVLPELCILCGHCVEICPVNAKKIRDDLGRAKQLLKLHKKVIVSLAPSFVSEFPEITPGQLIHALKKLGFYEISETALGAQEVSAHAAQQLNSKEPQIHISSACPAVVDYLQKYNPKVGQYITPLLSPVLAHCRMLREHYKEQIGIVFISPCIAKKRESDEHRSLLDVSITFADLREWLKEEKISLQDCNATEEDQFQPRAAQEGALYPVDGGMIASMKGDCSVKESSFMTFSGITEIEEALKELEQLPITNPLFLELLACSGGCINGPGSHQKGANAIKRLQVISRTECPSGVFPRKPTIEIEYQPPTFQADTTSFSDDQIRETLRLIGKYSVKDELNCSGCGYESCLDFAHALLQQKAEKTMCVSYMRSLAQKKANALMKTMPSGMLIIDNQLKIVECNLRFAEIMGKEITELYHTKPGLEGAALEKIVPFHQFFRNVLEIGEEILDREIKFKNRVLHVSIFNIERHQFVGAIMQDITTPAIRKEQVIRKAQKVIQHNLATVQKIAYLLGENASETEVLLESVVDSFQPEELAEEEK